MGGILPIPDGYQQIAVMEYDLYPAGFTPRIETYYIDSQYYNPADMCFWVVGDYADPSTGVKFGNRVGFLRYTDKW